MSVYVGGLFNTAANYHWQYREAAHLFADSVDELHRFALSIGLRREWFQDHPRLPHYDVSANKRRLAVERGAIELPPEIEVKHYGRCNPEKAKVVP